MSLLGYLYICTFPVTHPRGVETLSSHKHMIFLLIIVAVDFSMETFPSPFP